MTTVVDANVAFEVAASADGVAVLHGLGAIGPPLLWPEVRSALHVARDRRLLSERAAREALVRLDGAPIEERRHRRLGREAWRIADELGWSKTYDAEYLALAVLLGAGFVSFDRRMLRAAEILGVSVIPLT